MRIINNIFIFEDEDYSNFRRSEDLIPQLYKFLNPKSKNQAIPAGYLGSEEKRVVLAPKGIKDKEGYLYGLMLYLKACIPETVDEELLTDKNLYYMAVV